MLKKIRLTLAIIFWVLITWLLLDFTGTAQAYLGWMAKIQFIPALLALNIGALLFVVTLTLLMGRIYCSVICPLGVMQDFIAWLRRKKNKYYFSPAKNTLRYTVLVIACASLALGVAWLGGLIFPYSAANACNNPRDYKITRSDYFSLIRNVYQQYPSPLGMSGISVYCTQSVQSIKFTMNEPEYDFATLYELYCTRRKVGSQQFDNLWDAAQN